MLFTNTCQKPTRSVQVLTFAFGPEPPGVWIICKTMSPQNPPTQRFLGQNSEQHGKTCVFQKNNSSAQNAKISHLYFVINGAQGQNWTADTRIFNPLLYHWATRARNNKCGNIHAVVRAVFTAQVTSCPEAKTILFRNLWDQQYAAHLPWICNDLAFICGIDKAQGPRTKLRCIDQRTIPMVFNIRRHGPMLG